ALSALPSLGPLVGVQTARGCAEQPSLNGNRRQYACGAFWSFSPPALRECCHRGLARRLVAVRRPAVLVLAKGERPQPWLADRRGSRLHDSADDDAIAEHVEVLVVPLAGRTGGRGALEGQIVLVHFTEPTCAASLDHLVSASVGEIVIPRAIHRLSPPTGSNLSAQPNTKPNHTL